MTYFFVNVTCRNQWLIIHVDQMWWWYVKAFVSYAWQNKQTNRHTNKPSNKHTCQNCQFCNNSWTIDSLRHLVQEEFCKDIIYCNFRGPLDPYPRLLSGIVVAGVCLCVCFPVWVPVGVIPEIVHAKSHYLFKLEQPNSHERYKILWLRCLSILEFVDLNLTGQILLEKSRCHTMTGFIISVGQ